MLVSVHLPITITINQLSSGMQLIVNSTIFFKDLFEIIGRWYQSNLVCKELTHWKRLWCWEGLGAGGQGDDRGWDGWMASLTRWMWVWMNSGSWWWTGRPGVLRFMGSQRVGHDWATELNWPEQPVVKGYTEPTLKQHTSKYSSQ